MKQLFFIIIPVLILLIGCGSNNNSSETPSVDVTEESHDSDENKEPEDKEIIDSESSNVWKEYVKTNEFGEEITKKTKKDPRFYAEFYGTSQIFNSVSDYDVIIATAINDYSLLGGNKKGEYVKFVPVFINTKSTMVTLCDEGFVKVKTPDGKRYDFKVKVNTDNCFFENEDGFFSNHLRNGEDLQVVLTILDGNYEFTFEVPSGNFKEIYDLVAQKEASDK